MKCRGIPSELHTMQPPTLEPAAAPPRQFEPGVAARLVELEFTAS